MAKLVSTRRLANDKDENNSCSCEACGKAYASPIRLTNLSAMPTETYDACPFCFSKIKQGSVPEALEIETPEEPEVETPASVDISEDSGKDIEKKESPEAPESPEHILCPHHFGYLKTRAKDTPIPDKCLTCQKMIQCLL